MQLHELLKQKGMTVHFIPSDATVGDAIHLMAVNRISALIVTQGEQCTGIFTERDIMRFHLNHHDRSTGQVKLQQVMTNKLIVAEPGDAIDKSLTMMLQRDIRHLPVMSDGKIISMLYMRDLVQYCLDSISIELQHLHDYIEDLQEAGRD
jgi:CBS domain-containing protein